MMQFSGLYNWPGEGLVAAFRSESGTLMFDRRGLQHRIVEHKQHGNDTQVEEKALAQMNALGYPQP